MVKHDIHDPDEPADAIEAAESSPSDATESGASDGMTTVEEAADDEGTKSNRPDSATDGSDESELESQSIAELLETADRSDEETLVADGSGIPPSLTVGELRDILEQSRTITEAKRELELSYDETHQILRELGLIDFVTGRLASSYTEVPPELVAQRLTERGDGSTEL